MTFLLRGLEFDKPIVGSQRDNPKDFAAAVDYAYALRYAYRDAAGIIEQCHEDQGILVRAWEAHLLDSERTFSEHLFEVAMREWAEKMRRGLCDETQCDNWM